MAISSTPTTEVKRTTHTRQPPKQVMQEQSTDLEKCNPPKRSNNRYEDVGDIKRGIHNYERGVALGDSAALYVLTHTTRLTIREWVCFVS
jgi:hypothetical protein